MQKNAAYDLYRLIDIYQHKNVFIKSDITWSTQSNAVGNVIDDGENVTIFVNFLSMAGLYGPLSNEHSEIFFDAKRAKETGLADFCDIFTHRLVMLLYSNYKHGFLQTGSCDNFVSTAMASLSGFTFLDTLFPQLKKNGVLQLFEMFWRSHPSVYGLLHVLRSYFNHRVVIKQFKGRWKTLPRQESIQLGVNYCTLKKDAYLGRKGFFRYCLIVFGPLNYDDYLSFIPPMNKKFTELIQILNYYFGNLIEVKIGYKLDSENPQLFRLHAHSYLNFTTFLKASHITSNIWS